MTCKSCGYENVEGSVFCANCGAAMEAPAPAVETVVEPQYSAPQYSAPQPAPAPAKKADGLSITAMILGIVGLVGGSICNCLCGCLAGVPSLLMCIAAVVLGIIGMKKASDKGTKSTMALVGVILGGIGLLLCIIGMVLSSVLTDAMNTAIFGNMGGMDFMDMIEDMM